MAYIDEAIEGVAQYLRSKNDVITDGMGLQLRAVYEWETQVVPVDMMPCLMIGDQVTIQKEWVHAHYGVCDHIKFEVNGYLTYSDNRQNAKLIRNFASVVSRVFESRDAEEIPMPNHEWKMVWLADTPPAPEIEVGYEFIGDAFCRAFHMSLSYLVHRNALIHG